MITKRSLTMLRGRGRILPDAGAAQPSRRRSSGCPPPRPRATGSTRRCRSSRKGSRRTSRASSPSRSIPTPRSFRQGTEVPALQRGNLEMSTMTTFEVEQQLPEYGVLSAGYMFRDYDHMRKGLRRPDRQATMPMPSPRRWASRSSRRSTWAPGRPTSRKPAT